MDADFEVLADFLVGRGVEHPDRALAVTDIDTLGHWIIAELVRIVGKLYGIDQPVGIGVEDRARAVAFTGDNDAVHVGKIRHHLRLAKSFLNAAVSPATCCIENFHTVIAVNGGEHTATIVVHGHVVEAADHTWDRDNANQNQWRRLVARQFLRRSTEGKQQQRNHDVHGTQPPHFYLLVNARESGIAYNGSHS